VTVTADGPLKLSWSRLRNHDECAAKGKLLAERRKDPTGDIRSFFHGNVCDLAQRRWLGMDEQEPGWMARHIDDIFEESERTARETGDGIVVWRTPSDKGEVRDFCRELVIRLEDILTRICLPFDWTPGWRFRVRLTIGGLEVELVGEADLLVYDRLGRVAVWDLKATKDNSYWRKVAAQLTFYNIAVAASRDQRLGKWPFMSGLIQPMCDQQVLPVEITPQAIRELGARIERVAGDILAGRLDPKADDDGCGWCPVRHACPKFIGTGQLTGRVAIAAA
jgi:PD-(D/E)XK nuclease superfamily